MKLDDEDLQEHDARLAKVATAIGTCPTCGANDLAGEPHAPGCSPAPAATPVDDVVELEVDHGMYTMRLAHLVRPGDSRARCGDDTTGGDKRPVGSTVTCRRCRFVAGLPETKRRRRKR
jgi:hypothetical protein